MTYGCNNRGGCDLCFGISWIFMGGRYGPLIGGSGIPVCCGFVFILMLSFELTAVIAVNSLLPSGFPSSTFSLWRASSSSYTIIFIPMQETKPRSSAMTGLGKCALLNQWFRFNAGICTWMEPEWLCLGAVKDGLVVLCPKWIVWLEWLEKKKGWLLFCPLLRNQRPPKDSHTPSQETYKWITWHSTWLEWWMLTELVSGKERNTSLLSTHEANPSSARKSTLPKQTQQNGRHQWVFEV